MKRFNFIETKLKSLIVVERFPMRDHRGFLERLFCEGEFSNTGLEWQPTQINRTFTKKAGTARGLHFQKEPHSEVKLVQCLRGSIFDVAVDLRNESETFGQWYSVELSDENSKALLIPKGFAHGFQTLCNDVELLYLHGSAYAPHSEEGLHLSDEYLNIKWPLPIAEISSRDNNLPSFKQYRGLKY